MKCVLNDYLRLLFTNFNVIYLILLFARNKSINNDVEVF